MNTPTHRSPATNRIARERTEMFGPPLARADPVPLYVQIRDRIAGAINNGSLAPGDRLPAEPQLTEAFGVGRPTLRQAIQLLRQEGLLVARHGSGTFVSSHSPEVGILGFEGLGRRLDGRGLSHTDTVLDLTETRTPPVEVLTPALEDGPWWSLTRLRHVTLKGRTKQFCIQIDSFSSQLCPGVEELLTAASSATTVRQSLGIHVVSMEVATRAIAAPRRWALPLGLRPGQPLLAIERAHHDANGTVPHIVSSFVRTDLLPLVDRLQNPGRT